jgi:hypothetical protein
MREAHFTFRRNISLARMGKFHCAPAGHATKLCAVLARDLLAEGKRMQSEAYRRLGLKAYSMYVEVTIEEQRSYAPF